MAFLAKPPPIVTYTLQVAANSEFSPVLLEKADITGSRYTLTVTEALPRGQYYWRVKAVDGASNESAWSQVRLLKAALLPLWAFVLIIALGVAVLGAGAYFGMLRLRARRRETIAISEVEVPRIIAGQWRALESGETPKERQLPWRLTLPEPAKGEKTISTEDQARLMVIIDFAQSLPLAEPGYNADWLADIIETRMGAKASAPVYEQLLKGEIEVRYEPQWMNHPIYQDLTLVLEGQPVLTDLNAFVDGVNQCASQAVSLLQAIYREATAEAPANFMEKGGWEFITAVYSDAVSWFRGKSLREPSELDYTVKLQGSHEGGPEAVLYAEEATPFAGPLAQASNEEEASQLRALHLKLRRAYRNNDQARQIATMVSRLEVQRSQLFNVFSQFERLKQ